MHDRTLTRLLLASAITATLAACGGSDDAPPASTPSQTPPAPTVSVGDMVALTASNRIVSFDRATPGTIRTNLAVTGLQANENLVGIDYRPADGLLYGVGSSGRIMTVDAATGQTTLKATLAADPADTTQPYAGLNGTMFAVDFNPVADRLRVISNTGQSLRINVDTGATITDSSINRPGAMPMVTAAAYTNSIPNAATTQLFDIDVESDSLALQNPPNDGVLANVGPLGVAVSGDVAFDIAGGANGIALAALRTSAGGPSSLYRIDLATGAATLVGGTTNAALSLVGQGAGLGLRDIAISLQ